MPPSSSVNGRPSTPISASRPHSRLVEAGVLADHLAAVLRVVPLQQAAYGVAQGGLLTIECEVHVSLVPLYRPRIVPAMIWRWISLDPP